MVFLKDQVKQNSLFGTCNTCCIFHQGKQYRIRCLAHVTHVVYFTKESNTKFYSFSKARRKNKTCLSRNIFHVCTRQGAACRHVCINITLFLGRKNPGVLQPSRQTLSYFQVQFFRFSFFLKKMGFQVHGLFTWRCPKPFQKRCEFWDRFTQAAVLQDVCSKNFSPSSRLW